MSARGALSQFAPLAPYKAPHATPAEAVLLAFDVTADVGLTPGEAARRLTKYGPNALRAIRVRSAWSVLFDQFKSIIVALLFGAMLLSLLFGDVIEGAAIGVVIAINAALGFVTELRAVRSMDALRRIARVTARVRRGGKVLDIAAGSLVPGDIVILEAGMPR